MRKQLIDILNFGQLHKFILISDLDLLTFFAMSDIIIMYIYTYFADKEMQTMTDTTAKSAAKAFSEYWKDKGNEKQETARFWIELLGNVLGVENPISVIEFEKPVVVEKNQKYIDGYIPSNKILIEQKGSNISLRRTATQSDGEKLTPYGQAFRYNNYLPYEEKAKWIIVSNFTENSHLPI